MKGSRPPPYSSFSLTMTDQDHAVMVRGYTPCEASMAHVLYLPTMVCRLRDSVQGLIYIGFFASGGGGGGGGIIYHQ